MTNDLKAITYEIDGERFERFSSVEQDAVFHQHLEWQGLKLVSKGNTHSIVTALSGISVEENVNLDRLRFKARVITGHMDKLNLTKSADQRFHLVMAELRATQGVSDISTPYFGVSRVEDPFAKFCEAADNLMEIEDCGLEPLFSALLHNFSDSCPLWNRSNPEEMEPAERLPQVPVTSGSDFIKSLKGEN